MSLTTQHAVIKNTNEIKDMISDISKWEDEIKFEDQKLNSIADIKDDLSTSEVDAKKALILKDEGNKLYSEGKWIEAVRKYSDAILLDAENAILPANRAMAHIKLENFIAAEADCSLSLRIDPQYVKALLRRATARNRRQRLSLAAEDYKKVLTIEPWNKEAKKELDLISQKQKKEADNCDGKTKKNYEDIPGRHKIEFLKSPLKSSIQKEYRKLPIRDVASRSSIITT